MRNSFLISQFYVHNDLPGLLAARHQLILDRDKCHAEVEEMADHAERNFNGYRRLIRQSRNLGYQIKLASFYVDKMVTR